MVLDPSDMQRFLAAAAPGGGGFGGPPAGGFTTTGGGGAAHTDPSFMSIFKPLAALEIIKGGIAQLVASSQVMGSYLDAGRKIVGAFADLLMAALSPFINVGLMFMTTLLSAFVSSGLFQKLLAWSQAMSKDMAKWINDHAPQIEAFVKSAVEVAGKIFSVVGDVGGQIISKFVALHEWFDNHLGGFGDWMGKIMVVLAAIAVGVGVSKGLGMLPGLGMLGLPASAAMGGASVLGKIPPAMLLRGGVGVAGLAGGKMAGDWVAQQTGEDQYANMAQLGIQGAGLGFMVGGPMGAAVGGLAGLAAADLEGLGVPLDKIPGLGGLFRHGSAAAQQGSQTNVQNSGNTMNTTINVNGATDAKAVSDSVADELDRKFGGIYNTRS
jgi:hypothetical protein